MASGLYPKSINLNLTKNKVDHHTLDYRTSQLILRRGQSFVITLKLNRALRTKDIINFLVEIDGVKGKPKTKFPLSKAKAIKGSWSAVADSIAHTTVNVSIKSPVNAIIGSYRLIAQCFSKTFTSHVIGNFILLFNPWSNEDDVYLENELERKEYVLNDSTILYRGSEDSIHAMGWNLGQFEDGILEICLKILEKQKAVKKSLLYDPKEVSRVCSAMINSQDDKGVLTGNWSGEYADGVSPSRWNGSVAILRKWAASGPVQYGQCWVFAGVLCTVLRCLGIPNRIVTNFSSAHDSDENLSIDSNYDSDGRSLGGDDSIWNFHVWNEAWFTREDLGPFYNGWQVLDATPQETSDGIYRLGPTSVKAVKEGDIKLNYDGPFVFSEVNADRVSWIYNKKEGSHRRVSTNSSSVGKFTSTKAVGSNNRIDITSNYKYAEGTAKEREVYHNALLQLFGRENIDSGEGDTRIIARVKPLTNQNLTGKFKDSDPTVIGQDVNLILILNHNSASKNIIINFNVSSTGYTRQTMKTVLSDTMSISLEANKEKEIPFNIPYSKYIDFLTDDEVLEVTALCKGDDIEKLLISKVITLQSPSLNIKVLDKAVLNKPLNVEITVVNPLNEILNECELRVEGSGLVKGQLKRIVSMKANEKTTMTVECTPYMKGSKQLQVVITCPKIKNVKGYTTIDVEEA